MQDFEKLGLFYLGREYDVSAGKPLDRPVLYDSRDLVTHAVCAGMTGSGKTGLCLSSSRRRPSTACRSSRSIRRGTSATCC